MTNWSPAQPAALELVERVVHPALESSLLASLFPSSVVAREMREDGDASILAAQEAAACAGFRSKRLAEFAAGRLCARSALSALGHSHFALLPNPDRRPRWPATIVGSITHTLGFCGAVVGRRRDVAALGVDAEIVARVDRDVWPQVLTPAEFERLERIDYASRERVAALTFSAKESFYKGQFALTGCWLDFQDVRIDIAEVSAAGSFVARAASSRGLQILGDFAAAGRYRFEGTLVVTGVSFEAADAASLPSRDTAACE